MEINMLGVVRPFTRADAERLVQALESGEYKRATNVLHEHRDGVDRDCCLGVADKLFPGVISEDAMGSLWKGDPLAPVPCMLPHNVQSRLVSANDSEEGNSEDGYEEPIRLLREEIIPNLPEA